MVAVAEARRSGRQEVFNMSVETVQTHVWVTKGGGVQKIICYLYLCRRGNPWKRSTTKVIFICFEGDSSLGNKLGLSCDFLVVSPTVDVNTAVNQVVEPEPDFKNMPYL